MKYQETKTKSSVHFQNVKRSLRAKMLKHLPYVLDARRRYAINARFPGILRNLVIRFRKRCTKTGLIILGLINVHNALFL